MSSFQRLNFIRAIRAPPKSSRHESIFIELRAEFARRQEIGPNVAWATSRWDQNHLATNFLPPNFARPPHPPVQAHKRPRLLPLAMERPQGPLDAVGAVAWALANPKRCEMR